MRSVSLTNQDGSFLSTELPVSMWSGEPRASHNSEAAFSASSHGSLFDRHSAADENLPLVRFLARQLHARLPQHVDFEDLVSAGTVGLLDAVMRFDGEKKVQFRSYAQFRIRGAMMDSLREVDWSPRTLRRQGRLLEEAKLTLAAQSSQSPNDEQIADLMGIEVGALQNLLHQLRGLEMESLGAERCGEAGEQVIDSVPAPASEDPLFRYMQGEVRQHLISAIDDLPEKERLVLSLYYYEELTMKEVSEILGVVGSRVSQLHASAIVRLKRVLSSKTGSCAFVGHP